MSSLGMNFVDVTSSLGNIKDFAKSQIPSIDSLEDLKSLLLTRKSLVVSTALLTAYLWYRNTGQRYSVVPRWPPGPKPWPIIGNMLSIKPTKDKSTFDSCNDLVQEYGPMVHLYLGMGVDIVIISGTDLIYEAFVSKGAVFSHRALNMPMLKSRRDRGIVLQHGPVWRRIRTFTVKTLKELGLNKSSLQQSIQEEAMHVVEVLEANKGVPYDVSHVLNNAVSNVICRLVFNKRFEYDNDEFKGILTAIEDIFTYGGTSQFAKSFLPLFIVKRFSSSLKKFNDADNLMRSFINEMIERHRRDFDENEMRDFTDYYLKYEKSNDPNKISESNMFKLIQDLFLAGTETTSTILTWMVLYMTIHPEIQEKCRKEIIEVVGTSRRPSWQDRRQLPYTEAMLLETQRIANIAPVGVAHCTSEPVELGGYLLPEKTVIMPNFTESMTSERYWKDANTFNPQRWLDQDGQLKTEIPKSFIPFGVGPRSCPGDNLAKMEMLIFTSSILQRFKFTPEYGKYPPSTRKKHFATIKPNLFNIVLENC